MGYRCKIVVIFSLTDDFIQKNTTGHGYIERTDITVHGKFSPVVCRFHDRGRNTLVFCPHNNSQGDVQGHIVNRIFGFFCGSYHLNARRLHVENSILNVIDFTDRDVKNGPGRSFNGVCCYRSSAFVLHNNAMNTGTFGCTDDSPEIADVRKLVE